MSTYTEAERARRQRDKFVLVKVQSNMLGRTKSRAKQMGLEFDLDPDYIMSIWPANNICPVSSVDMIVENINHRPSLDRIDSSGGYTKGNVAVISWQANNLKNTGTLQEFKAVLNYMRLNGAS